MLPAHNTLDASQIAERGYGGGADVAARHGGRQRRAHAAPCRPDLDHGAGRHPRGFLVSLRQGLGRPGGSARRGDARRRRRLWRDRQRIVACAGRFGPTGSSGPGGARPAWLRRRVAPVSVPAAGDRAGGQGARAPPGRARARVSRSAAARLRERRRMATRGSGPMTSAQSPSPASGWSRRSARRAKRAGAACSRASAASAPRRCSTRTATAAASPRKSTWSRSIRGSRRSSAAGCRAAIASASHAAAEARGRCGPARWRARSLAHRRVPRRGHRRPAAQRGFLPDVDHRRARAHAAVRCLEPFSQHAGRRRRRTLRPRRPARVRRGGLLVEHDRDRARRGGDSQRPRGCGARGRHRCALAADVQRLQPAAADGSRRRAGRSIAAARG